MAWTSVARLTQADQLLHLMQMHRPSVVVSLGAYSHFLVVAAPVAATTAMPKMPPVQLPWKVQRAASLPQRTTSCPQMDATGLKPLAVVVIVVVM
jgi:hypothetical protein